MRLRLQEELRALEPTDPACAGARDSIVVALDHLEDPCSRDAHPTHVTGSALVVGSRGIVLHRHKRFGMWIQPGGHVEPGESPAQAALRETAEETGLDARHPAGGPRLVHVDVHAGPHGHIHLDLRYLLEAEGDPAPPSGESQDVRWFGWDEAVVVAEPRLGAALLVIRDRL